MDSKTFDIIAKDLGTTLSRRRTMQRLFGTLVAGGALGAWAARLGLPTDAAAKQQRWKLRAWHDRQSRLQDEGKRRGVGLPSHFSGVLERPGVQPGHLPVRDAVRRLLPG